LRPEILWIRNGRTDLHRPPCAVGPWDSPDPTYTVLPLTQRPHPDTIQRFSVPVTPQSWNDTVRCYHPDIHLAEVEVARELTRLAARKPLSGNKSGIDSWITKNERETGTAPLWNAGVVYG